ncbi:MAG TPA: head-tail connector protein [Sphingomicrobium sp.]|jgi:uncharacterized phiE125 gp8 family phage protein
MIIWPPKGPGEVADFAFDFVRVLQDDETLSGRTVVAEGVTRDSDAIDASQVKVWLSGGTAGTVAKVVVTVTTSGGRTYSEVAVLEIGGEAVSLAQAKAWLRVESEDEDALISGLVRAAVRHIERATGKKLVQRIVSQVAAGFPSRGLRLWYGPAAEMLSVDYDDGAGAAQVLTDFRLVEGAGAQLLPAYNSAWPSAAAGAGSVRLQYVAGYDPTELPPELTQAALMLVAHWYMNREAVNVGNITTELPLGVEALIEPFRPIGLG